MKQGIYKITSPSNKIYIGQSIDIEQRWKDYKNVKKNIGPKIKNSLLKYGPKNHKFEIIEECSVDLLKEKEIYWKNYYLKILNNDWEQVLFCELYDRGGGPKSEYTKQKISQANKGKIFSEEHKRKIGESKIGNQYALGFKFNQESKNKISDSKKDHICYLNKERNKKISENNRGRKLSEETKQKLSILRKNPRKKTKTDILHSNKENINLQINNINLKDLAKMYNVSLGTLKNFLKITK